MTKFRTEITKGDEIRYVSHLDYASLMERAIRRAKLPVAYSEGFNPHMKISFASALAVGVTSAAEYMDIELKEPVAEDVFCDRLRQALPKGVKLLRAKMFEGKQKAMMAIVDLAEYTVQIPLTGDQAAICEAVQAYNLAPTIMYTRRTPKSCKEVEIKQYMQESVQVAFVNEMIVFTMKTKITPAGSVKPGEILQVFKTQFSMPILEDEALIHRTGLYAGGQTPIDLV